MKSQPTHPENILREDYLQPLSITIQEMSVVLGGLRKTFSKIINDRGAATPDMALRLSRTFDTTPELWMNLQKNYDLWHAAHDSTAWKQVKPVFHSLSNSPAPANTP